MRILITRPTEDAAPLADTLRQRGIDTVVEPLLAIEPVADAQIDLADVQAVLVTSANGVRALARLDERRDIPVFAVGEASATAAEHEGFAHVETAEGDVDALGRLVCEKLDPAKGSLLHVAGSKVAGNLKEIVEEKGFTYRRAVLYDAVKATRLSDEVVEGIKSGAIDAVLFYSPRTAATFVELARKARLVTPVKDMTAFCLSQAVADEAGAIGWAAIKVAERPEQDALVACIDETAGIAAPSPAAGDQHKGSPVLTAFISLVVVAAVLIGAAVVTFPKWYPMAEAHLPASLKANIPQALMATLNRPAAPAGTDASPAPEKPAPVSPATTPALPAKPDPQPEPTPEPAPRDMANATTPATGELAALEAERQRLVPEVERLVSRVEELEGALKDVRAMVAAVSPAGDGEARAALGDLTARLEQLEQGAEGNSAVEDMRARIDRLEKGDLEKRLAALTERLEAMEQNRAEAAGEGKSASATVLAIGQLREALRSSRPFSQELDALVAVAGEDADIAGAVKELRTWAEDGVPSFTVLRNRLDALAPRINRAAVAPTGETWWQKTLNSVASVVSVKRVAGNTEGEGVDAIVAKADASLADGDLAGAVEALSRLSGPPAEVAKPWVEAAQARLAAEQALSRLHETAVKAVAKAE